MNDVFEFLVDSTSGLAPGAVNGKMLVAGVCSKGQVGKGYIIGKSSNLSDILGTGPLVDSIADVLATGGQEPVIVAVPVQGQNGSYISQPISYNSSIKAGSMGIAAQNADVEIRAVTAGALGVARLSISYNKGVAQELVSAESITLENTGASIVFEAHTEFEADATFHIKIRTAIGFIQCHGQENSPQIEIESPNDKVLAGAQLVVQIVKAGGHNVGTYRLSFDGADTFGTVRTIPVDGIVNLTGYGLVLHFSDGLYATATSYTCDILAPKPSILDIMSAIESPLSLYDVEFVYICGSTDSVDWAAFGAKATELWNRHQPTYFKVEARLPHDGEDLHDYTAYLLTERQSVSERFVQVCVQFGEVTERNGIRKIRNWCGLQAGRTLSIPVMRATGRVKDGSIGQGTLPSGWEAYQPILERAGYLTAKKYAGLNGVYWADSRTMAEDTSDYRFEEVLRVTFKAIRLMRIAALKSLYDEIGDPLLPKNRNGEAYLKAEIENALDSMKKAIPQELAAYKIVIPQVQDRVNNGIAVETTLIGIGIMRQINLYASYVYAGGNFDPRMMG